MDTQEFINKNEEFLKNLQNNDIKGKILVEAPSHHLFITHCMAYQALILNMAKGYKPVWHDNGIYPIELLKSYVKEAEYTALPKLNFFEKLYYHTALIAQTIKLFITQKALNFRFDGIKYGDILHDVYLADHQIGTLQGFSSKLIPIMKEIIKTHLKYKKVLKEGNFSAVLSSHRIGIRAGVLVRCALSLGLKAYTNSGGHRNTLHLSRGENEIIEYEYSPNQEYMNDVMSLKDDYFNQEYERIYNNHVYGSASLDAKFAFSEDNKSYKTKEEFCKNYGLDSNKKNIFIMLHAFTDHPHSHFKKMLFKDYGDWFLRTLDFAKKDTNVNWIFKEHPSDRFYPTKDIIFAELFKNAPKHVVFLSDKDKLDTRSLENTADAIITCCGSAGFEIPAFFGIPSITAGDNPYTAMGFAKEPQTKEEYFKILSNLKNIEKLTPTELKRAKAVYMFIYNYCTVNYPWIPVLTSLDDIHGANIEKLNKAYYELVCELYNKNKNLILDNLFRYAFEVSKRDFKALRTKKYKKFEDYLVFPYDISQPMSEYRYEIMQEGAEILKSLNIPYYLTEGTLLGIYRDGDLIPHDTDIDVTVIDVQDKNRIIREFYKKGFKIGRAPISYGDIQQIVFYKNEVMFDILFYEKIDDTLYSFEEKDCYFKLNYNHFKTPKAINFKGYDYLVPEDIEGYLESVYGAGWKHPEPKAKDWRNATYTYLNCHKYNGDRLSVINFKEKEV